MYIQFLIHVLSNIIKREEFFMMNFTNHETVKLPGYLVKIAKAEKTLNLIF